MRAIVKGDAPGLVTPLGVGCAPEKLTAFLDIEMRFGRDPALRCPFLADGPDGQTTSCSAWADRPSVCAAYYCRSIHGDAGLAFWARVQRLMTAVEDALRRWCVLEIGLPAAQLALLDDRLVDPDKARTGITGDVWGPFATRKEELFRATADLTDGLSWEDVLEIGGAGVRLTARTVRDAYRSIRRATPS
jgi:hypothetical protein